MHKIVKIFLDLCMKKKKDEEPLKKQYKYSINYLSAGRKLWKWRYNWTTGVNRIVEYEMKFIEQVWFLLEL